MTESSDCKSDLVKCTLQGRIKVLVNILLLINCTVTSSEAKLFFNQCISVVSAVKQRTTLVRIWRLRCT